MLGRIAYAIVTASAIGVLVDSAALARRWRRDGTVGRLQAVAAPVM